MPKPALSILSANRSKGLNERLMKFLLRSGSRFASKKALSLENGSSMGEKFGEEATRIRKTYLF